MEMAIIEAVLALVTLYLVMALLASQLNEQIAGWLGTRRKFAVDLVNEAFPGDDKATRVEAFYNYAPVYSLSKGSGRPSAIPPQLFAEAWLAVMYGKNKPPRADFRHPSEFVASLDLPAGKQKELVDWLVAGYGDEWDRFEERIATWYHDICDRAEGWYKRFTALRLLLISFGMAALLNVDTHYIFKFLIEHDDQRTAIANIGELINTTMGAASAPAAAGNRPAQPGLPPAPASPAERAVAANSELASGLAAIERAMTDPVVAGAGDDLQAAAESCRPHMGGLQTAYASNSEAWPVLLMGVRTLMGEAALAAAPAGAASAVSAPQPAEAGPLRGGTATRTAPAAASTPAVAEGSTGLNTTEVAARWRTASVCLDRVAQWVDATWAKTSRAPAARKALEEARVALARTQQYIETERRRSAVSQSMRRRYAAHPESVRDCSEQAGADRAAFAECLRSTAAVQLPLGWPPPMEQTCKVRAVSDASAVTLEPDAFVCADLEANPAIGLGALQATFNRWSLLSMFIGWMITALMVSLGAPFWFGVLGKVANLRLAGRVRGTRGVDSDGDSSSSTAASRASAPKPASSPGPAPATPAVITMAGVAVPAAPFADARNSFEQTLRLQDISRLQKALDAPPTGRLDEFTRQRIREKLGSTEELDPGSFETITGRRAPVAVVAPPAPSGVWTLGHDGGADAGALAKALNDRFPTLAPPLDVTRTVFNEDMRSRVVLYRLLTDAEPDWPKRQVVQLAAQRDPVLSTLDPAWRKRILEDTTRPDLQQMPPWFCNALGELGIFELPGAGQSNPRIDDYIRQLGNERMANDDTAWCGAFAGWVMNRAGKLTAANFSGDPVDLLAAAQWKSFGQPVAGFGALQPGDVCVMQRDDGGHHVAFFVGTPTGATDGSAYLLGGNQGSGALVGCVTLVRWRGVDKGIWRRAA